MNLRLAPTASPAHPRLDRRPLRRSPVTLQFGVDPPAALVVEGLTPPLARMVEGLDGRRPLARVLAEAVAAGAPPAAARELLASLHGADLLATGEPADPPDRAGALVVVEGAGRVGTAVACLLAASGVGRVLVRDGGTVVGTDLGTGLLAADLGRSGGHAAADAVHRAAARTRRAPRPREPVRPDLVVLAAAARPDPVVVAGLAVAARPHLAVSAVDGVGLVGPLVVPGRTPCLRCEDLRRADADPAWPQLAAELSGWRPPVSVTLATATAAVAVTQVLAGLDVLAGDPSSRPPAWGAVLTVGAPAGTDGVRPADPARPHPACGCGVLPPRPLAGAA